MSMHAQLNELRLRRTVAELEKAGITPRHLDDAVHSAASEMATAANNGGLCEQVSLLLAAGGWKPKDIIFHAREAKAEVGRPRYPEFKLLSEFLNREGVTPETEITFCEDNSADNRYALSVQRTSLPGLAVKLAEFWGCPPEDLPLYSANVYEDHFEASDSWHGQGAGDLREFGDEFGKWDSPFFDRTVTVAEIHATAQETT